MDKNAPIHEYDDDENEKENNETTKISYGRSHENFVTSSSSGGIRSCQIDFLTHPLDRSIALVFVLTVFFTLLAILSGVPIVLCLLAFLPPSFLLKRLCSCHLPSNPAFTQLSPIDSFWLNSGHVTHCLLYIDKGLSVDQLRDVIATRILSRQEFVRFKSCIVFKGLSKTPYWYFNASSDPLDFIEDHVIEDDPIVNKRSLRRRLLQLMSQTLPYDKPLWQIRWAHANYCNQVVLIVRVHQSLCDGVGLVSILVQYLSDSPPSMTSIKARFGGSTLPINIFRAVIVGPLTFFLWILWAFSRRHNNYLQKSKNKSFKSIYWTSIDMPNVYRVKQVTRSSLNDVILSAVSGAVRTYLTNKAKIFNPPDINISIPIDIRPSSQLDASFVGVNYVLVTSPLPTNTEGAIPRLWEVRHLMEELKTSADTAVMYGAHYLFTRLLPLSVSRFLINVVNRNSSLCVSNLPGPESNISIGSYRVNKVIYWMSPPSYSSIGFNVFSFNGKLFISISSTSQIVSSAKSLTKLFKAQLNRLSTLLSRRRVPGEGRRRKRSHIPIDAPIYQINSSLTSGANQLTAKLHEVQFELHQLQESLESGEPGVNKRLEELKDEFTGLMMEMRRRKSIADYGPNIIINIEDEDDDDNDGELRPPPRRFSVVSISRRTSIVSSLPSTARVTPPILSRRAVTTSPEPPSSPEVAFKNETEC